MAYHAKRTEHAGARNGTARKAAYWGPRADAKAESNKVRRANDARAVAEQR